MLKVLTVVCFINKGSLVGLNLPNEKKISDHVYDVYRTLNLGKLRNEGRFAKGTASLRKKKYSAVYLIRSKGLFSEVYFTHGDYLTPLFFFF